MWNEYKPDEDRFKDEFKYKFKQLIRSGTKIED